MQLIRTLLWPLAIVYNLVTRVRNHLYDSGYKRSFRFDRFVVSVGNLSIGGAGKTPMTEYLIRLLSPARKVVTLSRGYGRKTKGFRIAGETDDHRSIGDEPLQLLMKYGAVARVSVGEDRAFAIPNILMQFPDTDVIVMDDAFQHRTVQPQLSILLTTYHRPFISDYVLPAGNLREARRGARRADVVVVTKCPAEMRNQGQLVSSIRNYAGNLPVFFSSIRYGLPIPFGRIANGGPLGPKVILVTGIANALDFEQYVGTQFEIARHFEFGDHHAFGNGDLGEIIREAERLEVNGVVTTEKDMTRLIHNDFKEALARISWFYIPVEMHFLENGSEFDALVQNAIQKEQA